MIFCGKKIMAFKFIISLKQFLKLKEGFDPYLIFLVAMLQVTPNLLLRAIRMGSGSKNVPLPISEKKKIAFAIR
jgi:ribosomal protein S7